jgi:hypothetical protein
VTARLELSTAEWVLADDEHPFFPLLALFPRLKHVVIITVQHHDQDSLYECHMKCIQCGLHIFNADLPRFAVHSGQFFLKSFVPSIARYLLVICIIICEYVSVFTSCKDMLPANNLRYRLFSFFVAAVS